MSEIRRRNKSAGPRNEEAGGDQAPRRQTRVTLTKDVSSKYRKIMPKTQPDGKDGGRTSRRKSADDGSAPPTKTPRGGRTKSEDSRRPGGDRERRPATGGVGRKPAGDSSRPPARSSRSGQAAGERPERSGFDRDRRPASAGRRSAESGSAGGPRRGAPNAKRYDDRPPARRSAGPAAASKGPGTEVALKAIVHRELPEATKQVKETQELILNSANEMLALTEVLEGIHQRLEEAVNGVLDEHGHLKQLLTPLRDETAKAQSVVIGLYEKMSFQDLAGQRLMKVEEFLAALGRVLGGLNKRPGSGAAAGRNTAKAAKKPDGIKLKGPQTEGEGLAQNDIDQLLSGL